MTSFYPFSFGAEWRQGLSSQNECFLTPQNILYHILNVLKCATSPEKVMRFFPIFMGLKSGVIIRLYILMYLRLELGELKKQHILGLLVSLKNSIFPHLLLERRPLWIARGCHVIDLIYVITARGFPGENIRKLALPMQETEVSKHSVHTLVFRSLKRSHDMFIADNAHPPLRDDEGDKVKIACKVKDQYGMIQNLTATREHQRTGDPTHHDTRDEHTGYDQGYEEIPAHIRPGHPYPNAPGVPLSEHTAMQPGLSEGGVQQVMRGLPPSEAQMQASRTSHGVEAIQRKAGISERIQPPGSRALVAVSSNTKNSQALVARKAPTMPKPKWHPPWKLYRVISGHLGWVRSIAVEPGNQWFVTGAGDRVIKIWDLASGQLKLSLTGHVSSVRGLAVSPRQPYLFSCGEDKMVKCWDLEQNKVIRHYHGHLSACYALDLHPTIDILATCGRDATIRIWDMRSKACVHTLTGHTNTVASVKCQNAEPQIVSGSHDSTIRLWDLAAGKSRATLTNHKKSVRSVVLHPKLYMMASASPDNIKQWKFPDGNFMQNLGGHNAIVNCLAINSDNVLVSGGDNGSLHFWDWRTGFNFQRTQAPTQPGSLDSDAGIFAMTFDHSGSRLLTAEGDKTIKIYKEDDEATEETHPLNWKPEIIKKKKY